MLFPVDANERQEEEKDYAKQEDTTANWYLDKVIGRAQSTHSLSQFGSPFAPIETLLPTTQTNQSP